MGVTNLKWVTLGEYYPLEKRYPPNFETFYRKINDKTTVYGTRRAKRPTKTPDGWKWRLPVWYSASEINKNEWVFAVITERDVILEKLCDNVESDYHDSRKK
ncbi:MAG: hypothetical protein HC836_25665 [Richelia sp. RM2_1_2]|nr:hypothetical protein [Richelia sp. RM2_1_2]